MPIPQHAEVQKHLIYIQDRCEMQVWGGLQPQNMTKYEVLGSPAFPILQKISSFTHRGIKTV